MRAALQRAIATELLGRAPDAPRSGPGPSDAPGRRRRVAVGGTLIVGTTALGLSLATTPGAGAFYPLTLAVAAVWVLGALASGPVLLGRAAHSRRAAAIALVLGLVAGAVFVAGALIVREIDPLRSLVVHVLDHAQRGDRLLVGLLAVATGAAEEVFFRGAVYAAVGRRRAVLASSAIYAVVTVATGNVMLVFAAVLMGPLFARQRRATGGVLASLLTHVVWTAVLLLSLPPLLGM